MGSFDDLLRSMNFDYFGNSRHKTTPAAFFDRPGAIFVDLRSEEEYAILPIRVGFIHGVHIPLHELPDRCGEIPQGKPAGLFCSSDNRSAIGLAYLATRGFDDVRIVAGGYEALVAELKPGKVYKRCRAGD